MNQLLLQGIEIMFIGMGIVFLFLAMLIVAVNIMSTLIGRFLPTPAPLSPSSPSAGKTDAIDPRTVSVITAAIHQYRAKYR